MTEVREFVDALSGPTRLLSDHMSNFVDVHGDIPEDKAGMLKLLDEALGWPDSAFRPPTEELIGMML